MPNPREKTAILISSNRWNSAITEYLVSSAIALTQLGFKVVIVARDSSAAMQRLEKLDFEIRRLRNFGFTAFFKLSHVIKSTNPQLVMTFGGSETTLVNFMNLKDTQKIRFRGQNFHDSVKFWFSSRISHFNFDAFVAPAQWLANKLKASTGHDYCAIDLGMDEDKFKFTVVNRSKVTLTLLARFDPVKGHRKFFRIFSLVMNNWPAHLGEPVLRLIGREENINIPQLRSWGKEFGIEE